MRKIELLVPASSLEVLKIAVIFGADAVYIGGEAFGLRAKAKNFSHEDMKEGIAFAHEHGVKVYLTVNILAHNYDLPGVREYLTELKELKPDALIIADPGIYMYAKEICPEIERHISTQANNTNYETYRFWYNLGAKRVVTARELSLAEIKEIREHNPEDMEIETFVHGAMCISYSGRCLLSNYLAGRDANQGACTHPCRWKYSIVEEKRPGEYMPVFENERGTYIFNSKDLCMIEHMDDIINSGIDSLKIEGRMKTALYVATVARTYRKAIDDYMESPEKYQANMPWYQEQISNCTYRQFTTGFFYGKPDRLFLHIHKLCISRQPYQFYCSDGTVSLFGNDDLCNVLLLCILMIIVISVDKHYHIGILFNGSGFSKIRKHWSVIRTLFHRTAELRQCDHRHIQLSGKSFQRTGNI